ncbi:gamma-tubulin complex component 2 [Nematocida homosporus]|uniref:gamma-tubulin complex component 2 n=1 Tax=Nematocida homosporus TaxID=1912981 RepID=UPI00221EFF8A|nr:gamma-tubulin complex component 2 [Nematocida homosporus]KAI5185136.1 gamma-tubulin complex component 2 [Nematocida homosporus]
MQRNSGLVEELLYSMLGLDGGCIQIRKGEGIEVALRNDLGRDEVRIIHTLMDILVGVKEIKYRIEEEYYNKSYTKQCLLKGMEMEIEGFFRRVGVVRQGYLRGEVVMESLPFIFQEEARIFKILRNLMGRLDGIESVFVLAMLLDSHLPWECAGIVSAVVRPINRILVGVASGNRPLEYFEERSRYDYSDCFWSGHYKKKELPTYLRERGELILEMGKLARIRKAAGDATVELVGDILVQNKLNIGFNDSLLREYLAKLYDAPEVKSGWIREIREIFAKVLIDGCKFSELFAELGDKVFAQPDERIVALTNHILKTSRLDEKTEISRGYSFINETCNRLENPEANEHPNIYYELANNSLSTTLTSIMETKTKRTLYRPSLLQGLDLIFNPRTVLSFFFSTKAISEVKILFRLLYSFYAIEYTLSHYYSDWRLRQILLVFTTSMRMYITERAQKEVKSLLVCPTISNYHTALGTAMASIMQDSLLTNPKLLRFYSTFLSLSFFYIELPQKEHLSEGDVLDLLSQFQNLFQTALPHIKSPYLYTLFHSLTPSSEHPPDEPNGQD